MRDPCDDRLRSRPGSMVAVVYSGRGSRVGGAPARDPLDGRLLPFDLV